jgi:hypothetical protein
MGPTVTDSDHDIRDTYTLFMSLNIMDIICKETNREGNRIFENIWKDLTVSELHAFIGLNLFGGSMKNTFANYSEFWSESLGIPIFRATMSWSRFTDIKRVVRFDNKNIREEREATNKLAAIRQIWNLFLSNCTSNYKPSADLTVDEQLVPFRGNCKFRVYIKSKSGKYGMKIWIFADAETFYCRNTQIYVGKERGRTETGQESRVVKGLVTPCYNSGRNVTTDNFFTSYSLAQDLVKKKNCRYHKKGEDRTSLTITTK